MMYGVYVYHYKYICLSDTDYSYLDCYMIIITSTAGFNTTLCGCKPLIRRVLPVSQLLQHFIKSLNL